MGKLSLSLAPTSLEHLRNLSEKLGVNLWVKRDDLTGDIVTGLIASNDSVLFWHTGGSSALFTIEERWNNLNIE